MFSGRRFDGNKVKVQLKMLINRFNLLTQKKANLAKQQKRQVAMLLRDDKEANARILVEHIIREDYTLESYEVLKQHTEMLIARLNVMITEADMKPEISEAVCALLYAGYLMGNEIPELKQLQQLFTQKYGKDVAEEVITNKEKYLDQRLVRMLTSTQVPDRSVIDIYLTEIAKAYGVEYTPRAASMGPAPTLSSTVGVPLPLPGMPTNIPAAISAADFNPAPPPAQPAAPPPAAPAPPPAQPTPPAVPAVPVAQPIAQVPVATPIAQPVAPPMGPPQPMAVPQPFRVTLTKGAAGLGLTLDPHNVVTVVKPGTEAEACGQILPGDLVISLNGIAVSDDHPVKTIAIDLVDGAAATFVFLRGTAGPTAAMPAAMPAMPPMPAAVPAAPAQPAAYVPVAYPPAAPVATPVAPPAAPTAPAAPVEEEDEDDELAKRLEMLKRS